MNSLELEAHNTLASINAAWRSGQPARMKQHIHPDVVMKLPGFTGQIAGRDSLLAGFSEFCENARVIEYSEEDEQINVVGKCAVVSFRFAMVYERERYRARSRGRDVWMFERADAKWIAVWRTMVELDEQRESHQGG